MPRTPFWGLNAASVVPNEDLLYYPDPWDTFFINSDQLPGKCEVQNKGVATLEVEATKGKDSAGKRIRILGYDPKEFDVIVRIATPEQWDVFCDLGDKYWAGPGKKTKPPAATVLVRHPDLNRLRVYQGVIIGFPLAEQSDVDGAKNFRIQFHEEVKQRPVAALQAAGALPPEDPRQPASIALNGPQPEPSTVDSNMTLDGPKLSSAAGGGQ